MTFRIPFNRPFVTGRELAAMRDAIARGHLSGDGEYTRRASRLLEAEMDGARVLLTPSCTHALELAALLLDLAPGDEVILPSFTFVSTANAFVLRGARPVFVDIRPDTLNIDEAQIEAAITPRTRAIAVVHYAGVGCAMDAILDVAARHGLPVIEDNAHGLFGRYRGRPLGTLGALATLSFHETKNISCGEGGALVVNDPARVERAEILREKGTNRARFLRGQVDKYTWVDVGSSWLPGELLAAFLLAQLEAWGAIQRRRAALWHAYHEGLASWAAANGVQLPCVPADCAPAYHLFHLVLPTPAARTALIAHLAARGILAVFHYQPLHLSAMGRRYGGAPGQLPVTEAVAERLVRLPFYTGMTAREQADVAAAVEAFTV